MADLLIIIAERRSDIVLVSHVCRHGDCWIRSTTVFMIEAAARLNLVTWFLLYFSGEDNLADGEICDEFARLLIFTFDVR